MLNIKSHREKDSLILVALICSLAGIAFMTIASHGYINAVTNNTSNTNNNNSTIHITATANNILITNILAKNLENHIQKAGCYSWDNKQITSSDRCILMLICLTRH